MEAEMRSLRRVILEYGDVEMLWKNGVLSGYKFTAVLDSILNRVETRYVLETLRRSDILLECYQGDDAIVALMYEISRVEVASVYASIGLEVHPEKTWVTRGSTEYLHELYLAGRVAGFPARAFRAIVWRKPLTNLLEGEVGKDKIQSLVASCRMAARRGLNVINILRRVVRGTKPRGFTESAFQEWIMTPYLLGGFGAGRTGRQGWEMRTVRKRSFSVKVLGISHMGKEFESAAEQRARGSLPMPGMRTESWFERVKGDDEMPESKARYFGTQPQPRIDWTVRDLERFSDAYRRKLSLEWKLMRRKKITPNDLPQFFGDFRNFDRAYRVYRQMVSKTITLESSFTAGESYYRWADWGNRIWAGICYRWTQLKHPERWKILMCQLVLRSVSAVEANVIRVCV